MYKQQLYAANIIYHACISKQRAFKQWQIKIRLKDFIPGSCLANFWTFNSS